MRKVLLLVSAGVLICLQTVSSLISIPFGAKDRTTVDFPFVGGLRNRAGFTSSAVVLKGGKFAITTRHSITVDGSPDGTISDISDLFYVIRENDTSKMNEIVKVYPHPTLDLAIIELREALPFGAKIGIGKDGDIFYGVGYGMTSSKPEEYPPKFDKYDARKHVFKNRMKVDGSVLNFDLSKKETLGKEDGAVVGEGISGLGDSGGGMFVDIDGQLFLVGILDSSTTNNSSDGEVFLLASGVRVDSECLKWINSISEK